MFGQYGTTISQFISSTTPCWCRQECHQTHVFVTFTRHIKRLSQNLVLDRFQLDGPSNFALELPYIHFDTGGNHQFSDTHTSSYGWSYLAISYRIPLYHIFHYYCRASHSGDAPRVVVVAQNVDCLLCCHFVASCLHTYFLHSCS